LPRRGSGLLLTIGLVCCAVFIEPGAQLTAIHRRNHERRWHPLSSLSSFKRIFFTPVDQNRIESAREAHQQEMLKITIMNIR
jgi:hypothetical protein